MHYANIHITNLKPKSHALFINLLAERVLSGFIRKEIGRQIKLRHVPDLIFKIDTSMEYGRHIDKLISELDIRHDDEEEEQE